MNKENASMEEGPSYKIIKFKLDLYGKIWFAVAVFYNKAAKPAHYYRYQTEEQREKFVAECKSHAEKHEAYKAGRRQKRKDFETSCMVGDVFVSTWGWEQTNVDYYLLVDRKGNNGTFVQVGRSVVPGSEYSHGMACKVVADPSHVIGEPFKKRILEGETVNLDSYKYCHKWNGEENYNSWYA